MGINFLGFFVKDFCFFRGIFVEGSAGGSSFIRVVVVKLVLESGFVFVVSIYIIVRNVFYFLFRSFSSSEVGS